MSKSALLPTYARSELVFERGQGAYLFTASGERYLDFASGVAVTALGHAHPHLVKALAEPVLGHRIVPTTDARIRDRGAEEILREVLRSVPVPTEST